MEPEGWEKECQYKTFEEVEEEEEEEDVFSKKRTIQYKYLVQEEPFLPE